MLLSLLLLWIPVLILTATAAEFRTHYCGLNSTTYTTNTTYYSNLMKVLDSLASDKAVNDNIFLTKKAGDRHPNITYGLYLCRADVLPNECRNCLLQIREDINKTCPIQKEAIFWNDLCMLRYANYSMDSVMEATPFKPECNKVNISEQALEQTRFWEAARNLMVQSAAQASIDPTKGFGFQELSYNSTVKIYGYVQCTPDLSGSDCKRCLQESIDRLPQNCSGRQGARVLTPSCNVRFEIYEFLQFPAASSGSSGNNKKISSKITAAIVAIVAFLVVILGICRLLIRKKAPLIAVNGLEGKTDESEIITEQSLQFQLAAIVAATNNFSIHKKIGEGGFGGVYKGVLSNGQEIAVKRLSKSSGQGGMEFKNEVVLLAKLQHRNLVRLLGFCLEAQEKILIYEYVPNQSLDYFLFDPTKQAQLDWPTRYKIIGGIARGMLYLHEDSRLRIIHRDLKASNVLLDEDMNPKISDFGTARIFCGNQTQAETNTIVGTFGYMSPEYAMHGNFSVRSDVFSLGVLVLEIISGKRNTRNIEFGCADLLCDAWNKWTDGEPLKIMDPNLMDSNSTNEVSRCINVALLCVQEDDKLRPSMASVVLMLNSYSVALAVPQNPPLVSHSKDRHMTPAVLESDDRTYLWPADASAITEVQPR